MTHASTLPAPRSAPRDYGGDVNTNVAPFDAALPGALPSVNARAVDLAARLGFALGGEVQRVSHFDRKHYFYADLPHGYQITQHRRPIVLGGVLDVTLPAPNQRPKTKDQRRRGVEPARGGDAAASNPPPRALRVERLQLETDTGKSTSSRDATLVNLNRAGCALVEIVTAPDLRSAEEAAAAVETFQRLLRHLGVSDANLDEGSLRADVNVSVRLAGDEALGERCEVKNLNSVRSVARAVRHEAARHRALIRAGGVVRRQTRSFDPATGTTAALREKEALLDYRFAPEPDLPPVVVSDARLARIRDDTPELPTVAKARLCDPAGPHALRPELAEALTSRPEATAYYERAFAAARAWTKKTRGEGESAVSGSEVPMPTFDAGKIRATDVANFVTGELAGAAKRAGVNSRGGPLAGLPASASAERVGELLARVAAGELTARMAKSAAAAAASGDAREWPEMIARLFPARRRAGDANGGGSARDDDDGALERLCATIAGEMPEQAEAYRGGKTRLMGLFVGEAMKRTGGVADPRKVAAEFKKILDDGGGDGGGDGA